MKHVYSIAMETAERSAGSLPVEGEKSLGMDGEPKEGPLEKAGKDTVKAELSWFTAGQEFAESLSKADDVRGKSEKTIRSVLTTVLKSPPDSWPSFLDGYKVVIAVREKKGLSVGTLRVLRSQIARVLNAAKKHHSKAVAILGDEKQFSNWKSVIKAMPKQDPGSNVGRPAEEKPKAESIEDITNAGTLLQILAAAIKQLAKISNPRADHLFSAYMAQELGDMYETAAANFQRVFSDFNVGGVIPMDSKHDMMLELGLINEDGTEAATYAPQAAEVVHTVTEQPVVAATPTHEQAEERLAA